MPFYQFTVPADSATARKKAEVAAAVTAVHAEVTGAPSQYVNCSFVEVPPGSIFVAGTAVEAGRMVGLIRQGRSEEVKRKLITALADPRVSVTGEAIEDIALFLHEVPGIPGDGERPAASGGIRRPEVAGPGTFRRGPNERTARLRRGRGSASRWTACRRETYPEKPGPCSALP
jgi:phenylpyruvate tautomerase PptA (4-oxalocrotonate tautomerase family)